MNLTEFLINNFLTYVPRLKQYDYVFYIPSINEIQVFADYEVNYVDMFYKDAVCLGTL